MTYDHRPGLARIARVYGVKAELGRDVLVDGRRGRIIGHDQACLLVDDGEGRQFIAHPTWRVEYLPTGEEAAEAILVRRVTACMAEGLHGMGPGKCEACGVTAKKESGEDD